MTHFRRNPRATMGGGGEPSSETDNSFKHDKSYIKMLRWKPVFKVTKFMQNLLLVTSTYQIFDRS